MKGIWPRPLLIKVKIDLKMTKKEFLVILGVQSQKSILLMVRVSFTKIEKIIIFETTLESIEIKYKSEIWFFFISFKKAFEWYWISQVLDFALHRQIAAWLMDHI